MNKIDHPFILHERQEQLLNKCANETSNQQPLPQNQMRIHIY